MCASSRAPRQKQTLFPGVDALDMAEVMETQQFVSIYQ
jgi:hypothetical protein